MLFDTLLEGYKPLSAGDKSGSTSKEDTEAAADDKESKSEPASDDVDVPTENVVNVQLLTTFHYFIIVPLSSTWPHLNSDVGLEEGIY